jgi:hypothetical protein
VVHHCAFTAVQFERARSTLLNQVKALKPGEHRQWQFADEFGHQVAPANLIAEEIVLDR